MRGVNNHEHLKPHGATCSKPRVCKHNLGGNHLNAFSPKGAE